VSPNFFEGNDLSGVNNILNNVRMSVTFSFGAMKIAKSSDDTMVGLLLCVKTVVPKVLDVVPKVLDSHM
jgi:hypothetical protein